MATIFFDFDGVLVQSRAMDKTFLWQRGLERDLKVPRAVLSMLFQQPEWNAIISGKGDFRRTIAEVFQQNGLPTTADEFINFWLANDMNWRHDVLALAAKLKEAGHSLYIATNQDKIRATHIKKQEEVGRVFKDVFSSCDLGATKPSPQFYQRIQDKTVRGQSGNLLVIDDDKRNIAAAESIGWKGFHFDPDLEKAHSVQALESSLITALQ